MAVAQRVIAQPGAADHQLHPGLGQLRGDVPGLGAGQPLDPLVHGRRVQPHRSGPSTRTPRSPPCRNAVTTSEEAMKVLDGTQSKSTHAPPAPSASTIVTSASELCGHERGLVPGRPASDDHDAAHGFPHLRLDDYGPSHSPLRPERLSSSPCASTPRTARISTQVGCGPICPHSPLVGTGWLECWRLTFGGEDLLGYEGAVSTIVEDLNERVFVALYDVHPADESQLDDLEGVTAGAYRKLHVRVATLDGEVTAWVYVFDGLRGRAAHRVVPLRDRQRGGRWPALRTTTSPRCATGPPRRPAPEPSGAVTPRYRRSPRARRCPPRRPRACRPSGTGDRRRWGSSCPRPARR